MLVSGDDFLGAQIQTTAVHVYSKRAVEEFGLADSKLSDLYSRKKSANLIEQNSSGRRYTWWGISWNIEWWAAVP